MTSEPQQADPQSGASSPSAPGGEPASTTLIGTPLPVEITALNPAIMEDSIRGSGHQEGLHFRGSS